MKNTLPKRLLLASSSPYRRALLERLTDRFESRSPDIDETARDGEPPAALVTRLAREKCAALAGEPATVVIGSDQVAVLDGQALGKPGGHPAALEQLRAMRGREVEFLTAVCLLDPDGSGPREHTDRTLVRLRDYDDALAERYLRHEQPYDCAGSFKVEGAGAVLFEEIVTHDPTALVGLPLIWLAAQLCAAGFELPERSELEGGG